MKTKAALTFTFLSLALVAVQYACYQNFQEQTQRVEREKLNGYSNELKATMAVQLIQLQRLISKLEYSAYPKSKKVLSNDVFYDGLTPDLKDNMVKIKILSTKKDASRGLNVIMMQRSSPAEASLLFAIAKENPIDIRELIKQQRLLVLHRNDPQNAGRGSMITIIFPGNYFELPNPNAIAIIDLRPHFLDLVQNNHLGKHFLLNTEGSIITPEREPKNHFVRASFAGQVRNLASAPPEEGIPGTWNFPNERKAFQLASIGSVFDNLYVATEINESESVALYWPTFMDLNLVFLALFVALMFPYPRRIKR